VPIRNVVTVGAILPGHAPEGRFCTAVLYCDSQKTSVLWVFQLVSVMLRRHA